MGKLSKTLALFLTLIIAMPCLTLLTVKNANAQSPIPTPSTTFPAPSIPKFTIKFVNNSYFTQPTTTTNPYTGQPTTSPSQYVQDEYIELIINNQSFTPFTTQYNGNSYTVGLYFNIRTKGHFSSDWSYISPLYGNIQENYSAQYTIVETYYNNVPSAGQIDFQVQAVIGFVHSVVPVIVEQQWVLTGQTGGWSDIQTISIPDGSVTITPYSNPTTLPTSSLTTTLPPTSSPTSTLTPSVPELSWLVIVPLFLSLFAVALVLRHRKTSILNEVAN